MCYRVRKKLEPHPEVIEQYSGSGKALSAAQIYLTTLNSKSRVGSLRAEGKVSIWEHGQMVGYVIIEQQLPNGSYIQIGD